MRPPYAWSLKGSAGYRPDIDGLRALAVLPVVFFHAGLGFPGGFTGVDIFFVISGFLITSLIAGEMRNGRFTIAGFYERRIRRIFPALFAMLLATTIAAAVLMMPPEFARFGVSLALSALFTSNIGFWQESGYFDSTALYKPLLHTWSLGVEEQFYIVFPLVLMLLHHRTEAVRLTALAVLTLASLVASVMWLRQEPSGAFYLLPSRFWELGIGSLLALAPLPVLRGQWPALALAAMGSALIVGAFFMLSEAVAFPGLAALPSCLGTAMLIKAGQSKNAVSRLLASPPLQFVGLVSYSFYLWHWPVIILAQYRLGRHLSLGEAGMAVLVSFALAVLSWRYIEQPIRQRRLIASRWRLFGAAGAAISTATLFGVVFLKSGGWPDRLPANIQAIMAAKTDRSPFTGLKCFTDNNGSGLSDDDILAGRLCSLGQPTGTISFLVWGDSHAAAMAPAVASAASAAGRHGWFVGRGGCAPLIGYVSSSSHADKQESCSKHNDAVMSLIANRRIPLVILVARWPRETLGAQFGEEGPFFDPSRPYATVDRTQQVMAGLDATLARLKEFGSRVAIVMDVPEPGYDIPVSLARAALRGETADVNPTRQQVETRQRLAWQVLSQASAKWAVPIIDPTADFCDRQICRAEINGVSRYVDADHITNTEAVSLQHLFQPLFASQ